MPPTQPTSLLQHTRQPAHGMIITAVDVSLLRPEQMSSCTGPKLQPGHPVLVAWQDAQYDSGACLQQMNMLMQCTWSGLMAMPRTDSRLVSKPCWRRASSTDNPSCPECFSRLVGSTRAPTTALLPRRVVWNLRHKHVMD